MKHLLIFFFITFPCLANAWDGAVNGKVIAVDVTGGSNYGFRIHLKGAPRLCGNDHTWAFINENDSNYNTYVSALLAAKAAQFNVTVYTNRVGGENGYCKIGYISVH